MKIQKQNFIIILITILKSFLIKLTLAIEWEPQALANITQRNNIIIDTNNYLDKSSPSYQNIINYVSEIESTRKFTVWIYFIDTISTRYTIQSIFETSKNIENFTSDLAWFVLQENIEAEQNSLIILFAMTDRQSMIRTGKNVRYYLTDTQAEGYLSDIASEMRSAQYTEALEYLMKNLNWRITGNTFFYDLSDYFWSIVYFIAGCYFWYYVCYRKSSNVDAGVDRGEDLLAESTLEKIKRISERNHENNNRFLEDNCIVCMEEFSEIEKNEMNSKGDDNKSKAITVDDTNGNESKNYMQNFQQTSNKMIDIEMGQGSIFIF